MDTLRIEHANAMPAPTWSWLNMNDVNIEIPASLKRQENVLLETPEGVLSNEQQSQSLFEEALEELQKSLKPARKTNIDETHNDLDLPALSHYQHRAQQLQANTELASVFETGMGQEAQDHLRSLAGGTKTLAIAAGETATARLRIEGQVGHACASSLDVVAGADATLDLVIELDTSNLLDEPAQSDDSFSTLIGSQLRLFAGARSHVTVTTYLTASPNTIALDNSGYILDDDAQLSVYQVVLGGGFTATGLAADLRGEASSVDIDTRYIAVRKDTRDFNYLIRHHGRKTISDMNANGVLGGTSRKVLRGTIDLVHGCKDAAGNERETVLITNEGVVNKTVPTILCDEDEVAGNHGATIGHVRPEQLFYLMSRGISAEQAEDLFLRATFEAAMISAPNESTRRAVERLAQRLTNRDEEDLA